MALIKKRISSLGGRFGPLYRFVATKLRGDLMGRHAVGDRAMTATERHRKWLASRLAKAAEQAAPASANDLVLKVDHVRRFPERTAPWLCQRIGRDAAVAFRDALSRAIEAGSAAGGV
jgi:hypothetical protein